MFWYIVMALLGGWLIGWTTRGIIERHINSTRIVCCEPWPCDVAKRFIPQSPATDDEILLRDSFRKLRSAWFEAHLEQHAQERVCESREEELRRKEQNIKLRIRYDADTEAIITQSKRSIAPRCSYDMETWYRSIS